MAYVPPHKRLSNTQLRPPPELLDPQVKKNLNPHSDRRADKHQSKVKRIVYADKCISRCLTVPLLDDNRIPSSVQMVPVSMESIKWKSGENPLTFVCDFSAQECDDMKYCSLNLPWASVAEKVHSDLLSASQNVRDEMANESPEEIKLGVVARFGKVLFHRTPSLNVDSLKEYLVTEDSLRNLKKTFHTDVPISYVEHIKNEVVSEIGVDFVGKKEQYRVKLVDAKQHGSIISCKCRIKEGERKLELCKVESNPVRHLVVDISCLDGSVDLRLALFTKRNMRAVTVISLPNG